MTDFTEAYGNRILKGVIRYSHEHTPWVLCKVPLSLRETRGLEGVLNFALEWKADAIIGQFHGGDNPYIFEQNGIVTVAQDYEHRFDNISNITADYRAEGRAGGEYLLSLGARNFAFYGLNGMVWSNERRDGFVARIKESFPGASVFIKERSSLSPTWWYDLNELEDWLHWLPKPVAIMTCDDSMAYQIIEACQQSTFANMQIPRDIMLLGVDNDETVCQLCSPTLSSMGQQVEKAGYMTAELIDRRLSLPPDKRFKLCDDILVEKGGLVIRKSTDVFLHANPYIKEVCNFIHQNYNGPISVNDVAAQVPMSRRLLERIFREEIGTSIYQYLIKIRIDRVKALLAEGFSPQDAAAEMNIDVKALSRTFKAVEGVTLTKYAERYK